MNIESLTLNLENVDQNQLLSDWKWLVDDSHQPIMLTAMGDMFLISPDGKVHMLNLMDGVFDAVAETKEEFENKLQDPDVVSEWFLPDIVACNREMGMTLGPNQCYGMITPAFLSGKLEPDNIEPIDVHVYYSVTGQILRQVKDLPPGTKIDDVRISTGAGNIFKKLWKKLFK